MSRLVWASEDIELATGGTATAPFAVTGVVSLDTRPLQPGALFVASTEQADGLDFGEAASKAGRARPQG